MHCFSIFKYEGGGGGEAEFLMLVFALLIRVLHSFNFLSFSFCGVVKSFYPQNRVF